MLQNLLLTDQEDGEFVQLRKHEDTIYIIQPKNFKNFFYDKILKWDVLLLSKEIFKFPESLTTKSMLITPLKLYLVKMMKIN